ncbi:MAG: glycerate kinase [Armatimonadetes bacterium]|nr:glycerate kinase [Candidatus Hippobium faecium]
MNILICPDSFKGTMTASVASEAIKRGVLKTYSEASVTLLPLADGGEGTMSVLVNALGGEVRKAEVPGPLFEKRVGEYGLIGDYAVIESASACALPFVPPEKRNPLFTSTDGVGRLAREALLSGKRHIILTIGGIATNDCGIGFLSALGVKFYDGEGREVPPTGQGLGLIERIDDRGIMREALETKWTVLCDVDNYLCGEEGAAYVFGPQKGAGPETVKLLDGYARKFACIVKDKKGFDMLTLKHGGAAGGLGAGICAFFDTEIVSGTEYILKLLDFEKLAEKADLIITGEGRTDSQTLDGKLISGIIKHSKGTPVAVVSGSVTPEGYALKNKGAFWVASASEGLPQDYALSHAEELLEKASEKIRL